MAKIKIKKDDTVVVLAGTSKGKEGKVIKVIPATNRAIVEGVNMISKHTKPIWDKQTGTMFTGDTFGISYRDLDKDGEVYIFPSTSPVQFDPKALVESINKIMEYNPHRVCLTHFSAIKPSKQVVEQFSSTEIS